MTQTGHAFAAIASFLPQDLSARITTLTSCLWRQ